MYLLGSGHFGREAEAINPCYKFFGVGFGKILELK